MLVIKIKRLILSNANILDNMVSHHNNLKEYLN